MMKAVFTDIIAHKELGGIQVYWDDRGKILESTIENASRYDIMAIPAKLADRLPEVHDFLAHFGKYEKPPFSVDVLDFSGFSEFTVTVYKTLFTIPKGVLVTYGELAEMAGYARAARAVGTAMRKNRFLMLVPCHRVIASNSLGGFTTGIETKIALQNHEGVDLSAIKDERLLWH